MKKTISVDESHVVRTGSVAALNISINGQNGVDTLAFTVPEGMEDWAWRVEIAQNGETGYVLLGSDLAWTVQAGELREGEAALQLVGSTQVDGETLVWKSRQFFARVLPAINAAEAMEPGEASEFDRIAAEVKGDADRADKAAIRAEDAAAGAENIVNMAISDIEAEGQKQAAAVASSGTQALEAIGQVEQTAIAQVQAAGTAQVGAVEDAGDGKLAEIDAANAHVPQINETTGKWQVWDAQTGAYVDTDTDAQGPQGETGATGPQGPAGADGIGLPVATAEDAGKVPVVGADGNYTLGEPVPEVDATLTEAGAPADAAAVGEAIEAISPDDAAVDGKPWTSKQIIDALCPPLEATGNPVQCYPVAGYPLGVKAAWAPRQEGTGDPSPSNVRPIVGLDEVMVRRSGKNLIHVTASEPLTLDGVAWTITDGVIHAQGTASITSRYVAAENVFLPRGTYSVNPAQNIYYELISGDSVIVQTLRSFTLESDFTGNLQLFVLKGNTADVDIYPSIELGSTPTSYAPYTGTTATLDLPSTVYGGEVDVATGQGQETWKSYELNSDNMVAGIVDANGNDTSNLFYVGYIDGVALGNQYSANTIICTHLKYGSIVPQTETGNGISGNPNRNLVYFRLNREIADSTQEFLDWLAAQAAAGTPVTVAYKLATPTSITATGGQQIVALERVNTIFTNVDALEVTGRADPVATVQALTERVAALEQAAVNSINNTTEG